MSDDQDNMSNENGEISFEGAAAEQNPSQGARMVVQHVYLKDVSFEAPGALNTDSGEGEPGINMNLSQKAEKLAEGQFQVSLSVTITAKRGDATAFLCETEYAGVFQFEGFKDDQLTYAINVLCPNVLFPYARTQIATLVGAGGFSMPPLQPINFEAIFRQRVAEAQQQQAAQPAAGQA